MILLPWSKSFNQTISLFFPRPRQEFKNFQGQKQNSVSFSGPGTCGYLSGLLSKCMRYFSIFAVVYFLIFMRYIIIIQRNSRFYLELAFITHIKLEAMPKMFHCN